jgi:hypothetical protein
LCAKFYVADESKPIEAECLFWVQAV